MPASSLFFGYDPGGNKSHGVAALVIRGDAPDEVVTKTVSTVEEACEWFSATALRRALPVVAFGVDTLTTWSTGHAGFRPADRYLRAKYPAVQNSVIAPNSLYGAMAVNGMAAILRMRAQWPDLQIVEAHPKVLFHALSRRVYDFKGSKAELHELLARRFKLTPATLAQNDHEYDAIISAVSAWKGACGEWTRDLHREPTVEGESLVHPAGPTAFWWPDG